MSEDAGGHPAFDSLRERVVSLAGTRFEKYFHRSTATHIVRQVEGTEFRPSGIKGYGDFADEAYASYISALRNYVQTQDERRLRELEAVLLGIASVGERKVELQVQLPDILTEQLKRRASNANATLEAYVSQLLDQYLPYDFDEAQIAAWTRDFAKLDRRIFGPRPSRHHMLTVPVAVQEFERLERITGRLAVTEDVTLGDVVVHILVRQDGSSLRSQHSVQ